MRKTIMMIAIITFNQGICPPFFVFAACRVSENPPLVAVTPLPRPYRMPTPGTGFFFHEERAVH